jgi:hypothetical protein
LTLGFAQMHPYRLDSAASLAKTRLTRPISLVHPEACQLQVTPCFNSLLIVAHCHLLSFININKIVIIYFYLDNPPLLYAIIPM